MPVMPNVDFLNRQGTVRFRPPEPAGCILHRTENPRFAQTAQSFRASPHYPHFLVGKGGELLQIVDTDFQAVHVANANAHFLGIELSSIPSRWSNRQDPLTTSDPLTPAQTESLRRIVDWVSTTHNIPKFGPPSSKEMKNAHGFWNGFCSHADVSMAIPNASQHEEGLEDQEFIGLAIFPSASRQAESGMTELQRKLHRGLMTPAVKKKDQELSNFLNRLGRH